MSLITFAIALPIVLLTSFTALEVFMYFRAAHVVERAASEAAQAMTAALPGDKNSYIPNSLPAVFGKENAWADETAISYYHKASASFQNSVPLPFLLSRAENGPSGQNPGVQYLPLVSVWTCLEPRNETAHDLASCTGALGKDLQGWLTYMIPARMDYDGDGKEDVSFFFGNNNSPNGDWWVILSSSGTLFRHAMVTDLGSSSTASPRQIWLPCPGDFDGDGKTDFCVMRADRTASDEIDVKMRLSSRMYVEDDFVLQLSVDDSNLHIPVPGRYTLPGIDPSPGLSERDRFAVIGLEGDLPVDKINDPGNYSTFVWHKLDTSVTPPTLGPWSGAEFSNRKHKPAPGTNVRPMHADHDGDGDTDLAWLTWEAGYPTSHIAGNGTMTGFTEVSGTSSETASMIPWALYYPRDPQAPGLYVVSRNSHQVLLITKGSDNKLIGNRDGEQVQLIAGGYLGSSTASCAGFDSTFASPDPLSRLNFPWGGSNYACGSFTGDGAIASSGRLNTPTAVATLGRSGDPLFIADYGNGRIRMVTPGADGFVNGSADEVISTIAGGIVAGTCPAILAAPPAVCTTVGPEQCGTPANTIPALGAAACRWDCFASSCPLAAAHPSCFKLRPLSLDIIKDSNGTLGGDQQALVIGDAYGVVWILYPDSTGNWVGAGANPARLERLAGSFNTYSNNPPADGAAALSSTLAHPVSLSVTYQKVGGSVLVDEILVAMHSQSLDSSGQRERSGGVVEIRPGGTLYTQSCANRDETLHHVAGHMATSWPDTTTRPGVYTASTQVIIRNPTALVATSHSTSASGPVDPLLGVFTAGWWVNEAVATTPYENSILQTYTKGLSAAFNPRTRTRWLNNPHINSWGMRAPNEASENYAFEWNNAKPLASTPLQPGAGLALSWPASTADTCMMYVAETGTGRIFGIFMDQDGDGKCDYLRDTCGDGSDCTNMDLGDADGDGVQTSGSEEASITDSLDALQYEISTFSPARLIDIFQDAVVAITPTTAQLNGFGSSYDRLEWLMDRFPTVQASPPADATPEIETAPFNILGPSTIGISLPMSLLHTNPVYHTSLDRPTEWNGSRVRLAPVILSSRTPQVGGVRDVSGQLQCPQWNLVEGNMGQGLNTVGKVFFSGASPCVSPGSSTFIDPEDGVSNLDPAVRRVHPSRWTNQWHTFAGNPELSFLDADGNEGRNPALYVPGTAGPFLMIHIGNVWQASGTTICPGRFSETALANNNNSARTKFGWGAFGTNESQFECDNSAKFFTASNVPFISMMTDYHAESRVTTGVTASNISAMTGNRLSSNGPVTETAFDALTESLKVVRVTTLSNPLVSYQARVSFSSPALPGTSADDQLSATAVTVEYVHPLVSLLQKYLGAPKVVIKRTARRLQYNYGR